MKFTSKEIQNQYDGFIQTPSLWKKNAVYDIQQFEIEKKSSIFNLEIDPKIRLGKYIERFVSYQLQQEQSIEIISENIQIQQGKITLGELDCILLKNKKPIHLEVIYKFYLYNPSIGTTENERFIGPNKKDSLVNKLDKLKEKQLPLLYTDECLQYLKSIQLDASIIAQQVYFKAQLFVPFSNQNIQFKKINTDCIVGFYINKEEVTSFNDCKFYIPSKKDWLVIPNPHVDWLTFENFTLVSATYLEREFSPLCWIKKPNGEIHKVFLVWWSL